MDNLYKNTKKIVYLSSKTKIFRMKFRKYFPDYFISNFILQVFTKREHILVFQKLNLYFY